MKRWYCTPLHPFHLPSIISHPPNAPKKIAGQIINDGFSLKNVIASKTITKGDSKDMPLNSNTVKPIKALKKKCQAPNVKRLIRSKIFQDMGLIA